MINGKDKRKGKKGINKDEEVKKNLKEKKGVQELKNLKYEERMKSLGSTEPSHFFINYF